MSDTSPPGGSPDFTLPSNHHGEPAAGEGGPAQASYLAPVWDQEKYAANPHRNSYPQQGYPAPYPQPVLRSDYAPWGTRVIAHLIDDFPNYIGLAVFCSGYLMFLVELASAGGSDILPTTGVLPMIIGFSMYLGALGWTVYNRWLVAGRTGQSWGKRVTKIRLISEQTGQPIGPLNAFLRDLVHILDALVYVGYFWPLWDDKKQTLADMLMKTIVVRTGSNQLIPQSQA